MIWIVGILVSGSKAVRTRHSIGPVALLLFALLLVFASASGIGPFIYTLF